MIIKLSCPVEDNYEGSHQYNINRYKALVRLIRENGWRVDYFPVEVGARGYCAVNVRALFSALGLSGKQNKTLIQSVSRSSLEESFKIWLCRNSKV